MLREWPVCFHREKCITKEDHAQEKGNVKDNSNKQLYKE